MSNDVLAETLSRITAIIGTALDEKNVLSRNGFADRLDLAAKGCTVETSSKILKGIAEALREPGPKTFTLIDGGKD